LEYLKENWSKWQANADRDRLYHLTISTSLENVGFPERVVLVAEYLHEKRDLYFDWHQFSRKGLTASEGFGINHGLE